MEKRIACGDVVSGCNWTAVAATESELLEKVAAHAAHDHHVSDVDEDLMARIKAAIQDGSVAE